MQIHISLEKIKVFIHYISQHRPCILHDLTQFEPNSSHDKIKAITRGKRPWTCPILLLLQANAKRSSSFNPMSHEVNVFHKI